MSTRLSCLINPDTAAALLRQPAGVTITETVRRAVALYDLLDRATADGSRVELVDGCQVRELVLSAGEAG